MQGVAALLRSPFELPVLLLLQGRGTRKYHLLHQNLRPIQRPHFGHPRIYDISLVLAPDNRIRVAQEDVNQQLLALFEELCVGVLGCGCTFGRVQVRGVDDVKFAAKSENNFRFAGGVTEFGEVWRRQIFQNIMERVGGIWSKDVEVVKDEGVSVVYFLQKGHE